MDQHFFQGRMMKRVTVSVRQDRWDEFHIVRLVHNANKMKSDMDIVLDDYHANVKSITSMMDFYERTADCPKVFVLLNGEDEDEAAAWMKEYFEGTIS